MSRDIYHSLQPYQTRIIRLHCDGGDPDSPLVCDLYPADLLHPKFEGLGVRAPYGEADYVVEYDAISYTWGNSKTMDVLICNGVELPISENLSQALKALRPNRHSEHIFRYLWVDAVCINQRNKEEKSEQVANMLQIYQKAAKVIAWLGPAFEDMESVTSSASLFDSKPSNDIKVDFESVCRGLSYLYMRPYFQRIWIQQEVFGARPLWLQCGTVEFKWSKLLATPDLLLTQPRLQPYGHPNSSSTTLAKYIKNPLKKIGATSKVPKDIEVDLHAISTLRDLHKQYMTCFERFYMTNQSRPDFIDTLIRTGRLIATNQRDRIYGVLGMTRFPSKAMPLQDWARQKGQVFIPIDYSMTMEHILSTVTWALLMKGGLDILARFKAFATKQDGALPTAENSLPSWVIDWHQAAKLFIIEDTMPQSQWINLQSPWAARLAHHGVTRSELRIYYPRPPKAHQQFCDDNRDIKIPCTKLILRGFIQSGYYAKGRCIWEKRLLFKDRAVWHLELDVNAEDLIVYMLGFAGAGYQGFKESCDYDLGFDNVTSEDSSGGLWVLRPAGEELDDEFTLIACLTRTPNTTFPLYDHWKWIPDQLQDTYCGKPANLYRRLAVEPEFSVSLPGPEAWPEGDHREASSFVRRFTII